MLKKIATAASAALLLASTAGVAQASSAQALSLSKTVSVDRASSKGEKANEAVGGFLIPAVAVIAVITGAIILSDDDDEPTSP
jgi:hypothetical protein